MARRTAYCGCRRARIDLHLEGAAVEDMLVEQFLPPYSYCSARDLRSIGSLSQPGQAERSMQLTLPLYLDRHILRSFPVASPALFFKGHRPQKA